MLNTRDNIIGGIPLLKKATAALHIDKIIAQSNNDPSCAPHVADTRNTVGILLLELLATYLTEKSFATKA